MPVCRFDIVTRADPQSLVRALNPFVQQGLQPDQVKAVRSNDLLSICIALPELGEQQARIIAEKMRASFLVETVRVHHGLRLLSPFCETPHDLST